MRAAVYEQFCSPLAVQNVSDPEVPKDGVVLKVKATGLCRSDWHGWMGHDPDIRLPHVPGHELAGVVSAVGPQVTRWKGGERVTAPFVLACGNCPQCASGNQQVCDHQLQPGFTHWGSFAEYVAIPRADLNLVPLPDELSFETAASLGCRFVTSFRAIVDQARISGGEWVAVHGCGGVGLSAIMIASALGAQVIAIDISPNKLAFAKSLGAVAAVSAEEGTDVVEQVRELSAGGAHVSIDALGSQETSFNSIANLRKRGRHIQVGLMLADQRRPQIPMDLVVAKELEIYGSHGIQAFRYTDMMEMIRTGKLAPQRLVGSRINLEEACTELVEMDRFNAIGVTVINQF